MLLSFFKRRSALRLFLFGWAALLLAACDVPPGGLSTGGDTGASVDPGQPVNVALLVPAGSGDGNLDRLANNLVQSARLAVKDFPNSRINLNVYNTGGNAAQAASAARTAVGAGAKIIIGPLFAESAAAVGAAVAGDNINVLSFSSITDIAGGNVFVLGQTFEDKALRIVSFAASQGIRSVLAVASTNADGIAAANAVKQAAARAGVRYDGVAAYDLNADSIVASMPNIANQARSSGSRAVVLTADADSGLQLFGQMLPSSGLGPRDVKYLGITRWDIPSSNLSIPGLVGGWFTLPDVTAVQAFNSRFNATYGAAPHPIAGLAYDGISAVAKLLSSGSAKALTKSQLTRRGGFTGTSGIFRLLPDGTNERAQAVAEATGSTFRVISGAPKSFGGAGS